MCVCEGDTVDDDKPFALAIAHQISLEAGLEWKSFQDANKRQIKLISLADNNKALNLQLFGKNNKHNNNNNNNNIYNNNNNNNNRRGEKKDKQKQVCRVEFCGTKSISITVRKQTRKSFQ